MSSPALRAGATPRKFLPLSTAWLIRSGLAIVCRASSAPGRRQVANRLREPSLLYEVGQNLAARARTPGGREKSLVAVLGKLALEKFEL
jgi:hypothetical protein